MTKICKFLTLVQMTSKSLRWLVHIICILWLIQQQQSIMCGAQWTAEEEAAAAIVGTGGNVQNTEMLKNIKIVENFTKINNNDDDDDTSSNSQRKSYSNKLNVNIAADDDDSTANFQRHDATIKKVANTTTATTIAMLMWQVSNNHKTLDNLEEETPKDSTITTKDVKISKDADSLNNSSSSSSHSSTTKSPLLQLNMTSSEVNKRSNPDNNKEITTRNREVDDDGGVFILTDMIKPLETKIVNKTADAINSISATKPVVLINRNATQQIRMKEWHRNSSNVVSTRENPRENPSKHLQTTNKEGDVATAATAAAKTAAIAPVNTIKTAQSNLIMNNFINTTNFKVVTYNNSQFINKGLKQAKDNHEKFQETSTSFSLQQHHQQSVDDEKGISTEKPKLIENLKMQKISYPQQQIEDEAAQQKNAKEHLIKSLNKKISGKNENETKERATKDHNEELKNSYTNEVTAEINNSMKESTNLKGKFNLKQETEQEEIELFKINPENQMTKHENSPEIKLLNEKNYTKPQKSKEKLSLKQESEKEIKLFKAQQKNLNLKLENVPEIKLLNEAEETKPLEDKENLNFSQESQKEIKLLKTQQEKLNSKLENVSEKKLLNDQEETKPQEDKEKLNFTQESQKEIKLFKAQQEKLNLKQTKLGNVPEIKLLNEPEETKPQEDKEKLNFSQESQKEIKLFKAQQEKLNINHPKTTDKLDLTLETSEQTKKLLKPPKNTEKLSLQHTTDFENVPKIKLSNQKYVDNHIEESLQQIKAEKSKSYNSIPQNKEKLKKELLTESHRETKKSMKTTKQTQITAKERQISIKMSDMSVNKSSTKKLLNEQDRKTDKFLKITKETQFKAEQEQKFKKIAQEKLPDEHFTKELLKEQFRKTDKSLKITNETQITAEHEPNLMKLSEKNLSVKNSRTSKSFTKELLKDHLTESNKSQKISNETQVISENDQKFIKLPQQKFSHKPANKRPNKFHSRHQENPQNYEKLSENKDNDDKSIMKELNLNHEKLSDRSFHTNLENQKENHETYLITYTESSHIVPTNIKESLNPANEKKLLNRTANKSFLELINHQNKEDILNKTSQKALARGKESLKHLTTKELINQKSFQMKSGENQNEQTTRASESPQAIISDYKESQNLHNDEKLLRRSTNKSISEEINQRSKGDLFKNNLNEDIEENKLNLKQLTSKKLLNDQSFQVKSDKNQNVQPTIANERSHSVISGYKESQQEPNEKKLLYNSTNKSFNEETNQRSKESLSKNKLNKDLEGSKDKLVHLTSKELLNDKSFQQKSDENQNEQSTIASKSSHATISDNKEIRNQPHEEKLLYKYTNKSSHEVVNLHSKQELAKDNSNLAKEGHKESVKPLTTIELLHTKSFNINSTENNTETHQKSNTNVLENKLQFLTNAELLLENKLTKLQQKEKELQKQQEAIQAKLIDEETQFHKNSNNKSVKFLLHNLTTSSSSLPTETGHIKAKSQNLNNDYTRKHLQQHGDEKLKRKKRLNLKNHHNLETASSNPLQIAVAAAQTKNITNEKVLTAMKNTTSKSFKNTNVGNISTSDTTIDKSNNNAATRRSNTANDLPNTSTHQKDTTETPPQPIMENMNKSKSINESVELETQYRHKFNFSDIMKQQKQLLAAANNDEDDTRRPTGYNHNMTSNTEKIAANHSAIVERKQNKTEYDNSGITTIPTTTLSTDEIQVDISSPTTRDMEMDTIDKLLEFHTTLTATAPNESVTIKPTKSIYSLINSTYIENEIPIDIATLLTTTASTSSSSRTTSSTTTSTATRQQQPLSTSLEDLVNTRFNSITTTHETITPTYTTLRQLITGVTSLSSTTSLNPTTTTTLSSLYTNTITSTTTTPSWPVKHASVMEGNVILGGLMMVHSREDSITCGPIMPQGGIQALEAMLYTLDQVNKLQLLPNITLGAHILDDCDKDTYGLEMAVDFIKGKLPFIHYSF